MIDRLEQTYRQCGIEVVRSFDEVCRRADVYACDNSSSIYEFASTGRPVVLLNAPWFRRDVEHGLRFWAAAGIGRQVDEPEDLAEAIRCSLSEPVPSSAAAALRLAYSDITGAAERGATILAGWA
jgi:glycosyltransferase involved in cell wall biosynthesis